jgi:hypothetical protein
MSHTIGGQGHGSSTRGPTALSPAMFDPRPQHWDGERWVVVEPDRPAYSPRRRLATALGLILLWLFALTLVVPSVGFVLLQWLVIALAAGAVVLYLRRQRREAVEHHLVDPSVRR